MEEITDILDIAGRATVAGLLLLIVIALVRGWLVTRREYDEMRRQRDVERQEAEEWKRLALDGTRLATYAVRIAEEKPRSAKRGGQSTREART